MKDARELKIKLDDIIDELVTKQIDNMSISDMADIIYEDLYTYYSKSSYNEVMEEAGHWGIVKERGES